MGVSIGVALKVAAVIGSIVYQKKQQEKLAKQLAALKNKDQSYAVDLVIKGEAASVPKLYGKSMVGGIQTYHQLNKVYNPPEVMPENYFESSTDYYASQRISKVRTFLLMQTILGYGNIESIEYIYVDGADYKTTAKYGHMIEEYTLKGGSAHSIATANGVNENNVFTKMAGSTGIYRMDGKNPIYGGIPDIQHFIKGSKVRDITLVDGEYTFASERTYSENFALILADYMTTKNGGWGLKDKEIDLESFYNAKVLADRVVATDMLTGGRINGFKPLKYISELPTTGEETFIYVVGDTYSEWKDSAWVTVDKPVRDIRLGELNIALDTSQPFRENISRMLNSIGDADLIWTSEGKFKLAYAYPESDEDQEALVGDKLITDDHIIRSEAVTVTAPAASEKYNQVTISFNNEHEDFAKDSVSWPTSGSEVHTQYLAEDGDRVSSYNFSLEGITNPYTALARAEQICRMSRDTFSIEMTVSKDFINLEAGDFVDIDSEVVNLPIDCVFKVMSVKVNDDFTVRLSLMSYRWQNLAWNVADDIPYKERPSYSFETPAPTNVVTTVEYEEDDEGKTRMILNISWDDTGATLYEVRYKRSDRNRWHSVTTALNEVSITVNKEATYDIEVIANQSGFLSPAAESFAIVSSNTTKPNKPFDITATGGYQSILLKWSNPNQKTFSHVEIYESGTNSFASASLIDTRSGTRFQRLNLENNERKYYWLRSVNKLGVSSDTTAVVFADTDTGLSSGSADDILSAFNELNVEAITLVDDVTQIDGDYVDQMVLDKATGKLYTWDGTQWVAVIAEAFAEDLKSQIQSAMIAVDAIQPIHISPAAIDEEAIAENAITVAKIRDNAITELKIAAEAVTAAKVAAGAITEVKIDDEAITNAKIAAGAITEVKIDDDAITNAKIAAGAVTETSIEDGSISTPKLIAGAVTASTIASGAITTAKLAAGSVTATNIATNAVTAGKIAANAVTASTIAADAVTASKIAANAVTAEQIAANAVTAGKVVAGAIDTDHIATGAITSGKIHTDAVTADKIYAHAVTVTKIATDAVTADKILAGSVETSKLAANAVTANKIDSLAVTADKLAANSVTAGKIAANAVTAREIVAGEVKTAQLDALAVTAAKISSEAVTADKIKAGSISAGLLAASGVITKSAQIDDGIIETAHIKDAQIGSAKIKDAAITNAKIAGIIQSDDFVSGSTGWKINKSGGAEFNGVVVSRQLKLNWGSFIYGGNLNTDTDKDFFFVNTGIKIGRNDVWNSASRTFLGTAVAIPSSFTATSNTSVHRCKCDVYEAFKYYGSTFGSGGAVNHWNDDPDRTVNPSWASGQDQRIFMDINLRTQSQGMINPITIYWTVYEVT